MKKSILFVTSAIILAAVATTSIYIKKKTVLYDELFIANVDALANGEESNNYTCETRITTGDGNTFFCGSCDWVSGAVPTFWSSTSQCTK